MKLVKAGRPAKKSVKETVNSIFTWLGIPLEFSDGNRWQSWQATSLATGQLVTVESAMQISAVWACVRLIAGTISTLPLRIYKENPDGSRQIQQKHPASRLIGKFPNADMTAAQFWEALVAAVLLWGDGFAEVVRIGNRPIELHFLLPNRVSRRRLITGEIEYMYTDFNGKQRKIPEASIMRIPGLSMDGVNGVSVIAYGANVFGAAQAATEQSGKLFENGLRPGGVLKIDKFLTPKQRDDARANLVDNFSGSANGGKTLLLEGGMEFAPLSLQPGDAQLLETRKFDVEEICRWFAVPPFMVGHSEKNTSWGTGIEQQMLGFLTFALRPWLVRITQAVDRRLLTPGEQETLFADFDVDELLRPDSAGRSTFYGAMTQNGIITRNEARRRERLPAMDGGDQLTVQSNLVPLEKLGELGGQPTPGPTDPNTPANPAAGKQ